MPTFETSWENHEHQIVIEEYYVATSETWCWSCNSPQIVYGVLIVIRDYFQQLPSQHHEVGHAKVNCGANSRLEQFKRLGPFRFDGRLDPLFVVQWIRQVVKTFEAIGCVDAQKASFAFFILEGKVDVWWITNKRMLKEEGTVIIQPVFSCLDCFQMLQ